MDVEQKAAQLLAARGGDGPVTGGLALREALKQARLDDSLESLDRMQALLTHVRRQVRPTPEQWSQDTSRENFLLLLAFHMGELVARHTGDAVRWMSYADAKRVLPPELCPEEAPWSRVLGLMPRSICVPLGIVEDHLYNERPAMGCKAYVQRLVARAAATSETDVPLQEPVRILRISAVRAAGDPLPRSWQEAAGHAGFLAAWGMSLAWAGRPIAPQVLVPQPGGGYELSDFTMHATPARASEAAEAMMANPAPDLPCQVMLDPSSAVGREALLLDLRCYKPRQGNAPALRSMIVCPYRPDPDRAKFVIHSPKLVASTAPAPFHPELFRHFYQAIEAFAVDGFTWRQYLDERS